MIANPTAGKGNGKTVAGKVREALLLHNISHELLMPQSLENFRAIPRDLSKDFSELWIVGGDGSLHHTVNHFSDISMPIALFSAGTGNDFAKELCNDPSFEQQLKIALNGRVIAVDAGSCNDRIFCSGIGIGFDGAVAEKMQQPSRFNGRWAYFSAVLQLLMTYRETQLLIEANKTCIAGRFFMFTIGNGTTFGGGFKVTPLANIQDGSMDVCAIKKIHPLLRLLHLPKLEKGRHLGLSFVDYFTIKQILVKAQHPVPCHMDGEFFRTDTFDIRLLPGFLKFRSA